ncbi:AAA family ATPase [Limosilactobacillus reuteri]|uniref:AAA family ATPase n=1 Tax=Limosilactobacillus reuteri TaxID=1598 RepID=UPI002361AA99|nr:AAA family ATPase [Limosilactobacillus reuteri]MDD1401132.1 AAA family ATPase [Limosilactobacillus reuteri]
MSQISKVCGIEVKGRIFSELTPLQLLGYRKRENEYDSRVSLIYGENGSGKTTISRAFLQSSGKQQGLEKANFIDKNGFAIDLEEENSNVYVFNEEYITSNIRVKEESLNSIVILGEQKKVDDELNDMVEKEKKPLEEQIQKQQRQLEMMNDSTNVNSDLYYIERIEQSLKGDDCWAGRGREIKGQKNNVRVTKTRWMKIATLSTSESVTELREKLAMGLDKIHNIRKMANNSYIQTIPTKSTENLKQQVIKVCKLLEREIDEPFLNDKGKAIELAIKATVEEQDLHKTIDYFSKRDKHYCPFCLQSVSNDYVNELVKNIEAFLNDEVKKHETELKSSKIDSLDIDFSSYEKLDPLACKSCKDDLNKLNREIEKINNRIDEKLRRPFIPLSINIDQFNFTFHNFMEDLNHANKYIEDFKEQSAQIEEFKNQLYKINDKIAHFEILEYYNEYTKKSLEKKQLEKKKEENREKLNQVNRKINTLIEKKKSIVIAVSEINDALQYIFFSKDRLSIKVKNDNYVLYSRGKPVRPGNVSVGERNAIALCYFFTSLLKDKNKDEAYAEPAIIVIDDPISSFDMENKVGVISYLRYELEKFIQNKDTKIVVLTHDLQVFFDAEKIFKELLPDMKKRNIVEYRLNSNKLEELETKNEYTLMLKDIYSYANGEDGVNETTIGNEMRRVLEAFATFLYREGIEAISTNKDILKCLSQDERGYFKNRMYRLVLHGESHSEEKIKTIDDLNFYPFISSTEKRRTAQDIVCFMYSLNKAHLHAHLCYHNNGEQWETIQKAIKSWRKERGFIEVS